MASRTDRTRLEALEDFAAPTKPHFTRDLGKAEAALLFAAWLRASQTVPPFFFDVPESERPERLRLAAEVSFTLASMHLRKGVPLRWTEGGAKVIAEGGKLCEDWNCEECGAAYPVRWDLPPEGSHPIRVCLICGGRVGHFAYFSAHDGKHPNGEDSKNPSHVRFNYDFGQALWTWREFGLLDALKHSTAADPGEDDPKDG